MLQKPDAAGKVWPDFPQLNVWVVLLIVVAISMVFGLVNGIVISYLNVPAFIGTLGMQMIVYGITEVISPRTAARAGTVFAAHKAAETPHTVTYIFCFFVIKNTSQKLVNGVMITIILQNC